MLGRPHLPGPLGRPVAALVHDWSTASAQRARRNAMVASTACAERRAEREEVAAYLDGRSPADRSAEQTSSTVRRSAAR